MCITRTRLLRQAVRTGWFKSAYAFTPSDLPIEFTQEFQHILNETRGGGYFIWRFPILEEMMNRIPEGDFFIFLDAGAWINRYAESTLIEWLHQLNSSEYDEFGFETTQKENVWTTTRLFEAFGIPEDSAIRESNQLFGGYLIMRNGPHLRSILKSIYEVLRKDPYLITDKYNLESKQLIPGFKENRHDQSFHSLARKIHGCLKVKLFVHNNTPFPNYKLRTISAECAEEMEAEEIADPTVINDT